MKFRRKPITVEVVQYVNTDLNNAEIKNFLGINDLVVSYAKPMQPELVLDKLRIPKGWYIGKTILGNIIAISPEDFREDYERVAK